MCLHPHHRVRWKGEGHMRHKYMIGSLPWVLYTRVFWIDFHGFTGSEAWLNSVFWLEDSVLHGIRFCMDPVPAVRLSCLSYFVLCLWDSWSPKFIGLIVLAWCNIHIVYRRGIRRSYCSSCTVTYSEPCILLFLLLSSVVPFVMKSHSFCHTVST